MQNPDVDIIAESNGVLADTFHEGVRASFSWKASAPPRRAVSAPSRASIVMPKLAEDEEAQTNDEMEQSASSRRMSSLTVGGTIDGSHELQSVQRKDSINSNPMKRKVFVKVDQ